MTKSKSPPFPLLLGVVFLGAASAHAQAQTIGRSPKFVTPALIQANAQFTKAMGLANERYIAGLDTALKAAMTAGNLAEANEINAAKTALESNSPPPNAEFKSVKANEAKRNYDAANSTVKAAYIAILQGSLKPVLSAGKLDEANAIQSEIQAITGASGKTPENASPNETADLAVSGSGFTISTIQENGLAFGNRGFVWQDVPAAIRGWRFTKTNGGTRAEIKVKAKQETVVHAFTDLTDPGVKMSGWDRTGMHFTYNNGKGADMVMFKKKIKAGEEIDVPQGNWCGVIVLLPSK